MSNEKQADFLALVDSNRPTNPDMKKASPVDKPEYLQSPLPEPEGVISTTDERPVGVSEQLYARLIKDADTKKITFAEALAQYQKEQAKLDDGLTWFQK